MNPTKRKAFLMSGKVRGIIASQRRKMALEELIRLRRKKAATQRGKEKLHLLNVEIRRIESALNSIPLKSVPLKLKDSKNRSRQVQAGMDNKIQIALQRGVSKGTIDRIFWAYINARELEGFRREVAQVFKPRKKISRTELVRESEAVVEKWKEKIGGVVGAVDSRKEVKERMVYELGLLEFMGVFDPYVKKEIQRRHRAFVRELRRQSVRTKSGGRVFRRNLFLRGKQISGDDLKDGGW